MKPMTPITKSASAAFVASVVSLIHIDDLTSLISLIIAAISLLILLFNLGRKILELFNKASNEASEGGKKITLGEWLEILKGGAEALEQAKKDYPEVSGALDALAESIKKDQTEVKK